MKVGKRSIGVAGILAVIALICLTGILGWVAYEQLKDTPNTKEADTAQEINTKAEQEEDIFAEEIADWKTETINPYGLSFKYPESDSWTSSLGVVDSLMRGHEAVISVNYTPCAPNCGYALSIGVFNKEFEAGSQSNFGTEQMNGNTFYTLASMEEVEKDGVRGTRWEYTPDDSTAASIIYYYFSTGDYSFTFTVNSNGAVTDSVDITATGEKIMKTVEFID